MFSERASSTSNGPVSVFRVPIHHDAPGDSSDRDLSGDPSSARFDGGNWLGPARGIGCCGADSVSSA